MELFNTTESFDLNYFTENTTDLYNFIKTTTENITLENKHKTQLILYDILIPTFGIVIIVLNLAVVISSGLILKKGSQPRSTYLFLGNVAMCDLVTGISILFGQFFPREYRNQPVCAFQLGLITSSTLTSIYSVGLIAIDRYLYIIHGLQYQRWVYPTRARLCILITWIIGGIVGFLPIMGWSGDTLNGKICWFIRLVPPNLIIMTCIIGLIPIIVVIVLYSIILYHAIKKVIQLREAKKNTDPSRNENNNHNLRIFVGNQNAAQVTNANINNEEVKRSNILRRIFIRKTNKNLDTKQPEKVPSKSKAVIVVLLITGSFAITWMPYFVTSFLYVQCDPKLTPKKCKNLQVLIASPLAILGFCNSLLNPIIYAWWHNGFRTSVKRMFRRQKMNIQGQGSSNDTKSSNQSTQKISINSNSEQIRNDISTNVHI